MDFDRHNCFISDIKKTAFILAALLSLGLVSCEKKKVAPVRSPYNIQNLLAMPFYADTLLPGNIDSVSITASDSVSIIRPDKARNYLGQTAEQYLTYQMIGLAATTYATKDNITYVEIAQFADNSYAYGFYASLRPDGIAVKKLGAESYTMADTVYFTKGEFVITLSPENDNKSGRDAIDMISRTIEKKIDARNTLPLLFMLFPYAGKIYPSTGYCPFRFLDIPGFDQVYTTSYLNNNDTLVLFLTMDGSGEKYLHLREYAQALGKTLSNPEGFSFDKDYSVAFNYPEKGVIVAGLVRGKLVGAIGYNPGTNQRLTTGWVKGLQ